MRGFTHFSWILGFLPVLSFATVERGYFFPENFKWCVATSAHQIEGGNIHSDWWTFEQIPGNVRNEEISGEACDHWNRLEEDTRLLQKIKAQVYRFSVEWAKIEPFQGQINQEALEHYREELELLKQAGITPMVTLHHFTFPLWVREKGGWEWDGIQEAFRNYTQIVYQNLGSWIRDWMTINEPMVHLMGGYYVGLTPPQEKRELKGVIDPMVGLLKAHAASYRELHRQAKQQGKSIRVGIAYHHRAFDPYQGWNPIDLWLTPKIRDAWNFALMRAVESGKLKISLPFTLEVEKYFEEVKGTQDFIGLNYYSRNLVHYSVKNGLEVYVKEDAPKNDLGWEIYPEGLYRVLKEIQDRYPKRTIFITENGLADSKDSKRKKFIAEHLIQLHRALGEGVKVEGYCHWSLMDNFEWIEGFEPRFGLYEVDYSTQTRTLRESGAFYRDVIRNHGFIW